MVIIFFDLKFRVKCIGWNFERQLEIISILLIATGKHLFFYRRIALLWCECLLSNSIWHGFDKTVFLLQGLEKYVMTKLFSRTFGSPEDAKIDQEISDKIRLLQQFLRPVHLDIPKVFHNEASWLVLLLTFSIW